MPSKTKSPTPTKAKRGFAKMSNAQRLKIAAAGGRVSAKKQKRDAFGQFAGNHRSSR